MNILSDYSPISTNLYDSQGKQIMGFGKEKSFYIPHLQSGLFYDYKENNDLLKVKSWLYVNKHFTTKPKLY